LDSDSDESEEEDEDHCCYHDEKVYSTSTLLKDIILELKMNENKSHIDLQVHNLFPANDVDLAQFFASSSAPKNVKLYNLAVKSSWRVLNDWRVQVKQKQFALTPATCLQDIVLDPCFKILHNFASSQI
jgi:hypothetical protein